MDLGLSGKRALVTGSSRGTGTVMARTLAREGAVVLVHGSADGDQTRIAREIVLAGGVAHAVSGDVTTDEGGERVASAVKELVGGVDVLVNNLGQASGGDWQSATPDDWVASYQLNTLSAVRMIRAFLGGMRERRFGRIIQIATIGTTRPGSRMPQYYAAKAALANLTVSLAKELLGTGITVNTVSPGLIHTPETEIYLRHLGEKRGWGESWDEIEKSGVKKLTGSPIGRMAKPEEVADLVAFVASERASYLHGANVRVDGGATDAVQ
jgi:3-oxoacyl-[acyl-carrier protein] reductase